MRLLVILPCEPRRKLEEVVGEIGIDGGAMADA